MDIPIPWLQWPRRRATHGQHFGACYVICGYCPKKDNLCDYYFYQGFIWVVQLFIIVIIQGHTFFKEFNVGNCYSSHKRSWHDIVRYGNWHSMYCCLVLNFWTSVLRGKGILETICIGYILLYYIILIIEDTRISYKTVNNLLLNIKYS